jgi:hypothetical protein
MFLKVIACEIAARELQHTAARSKNLIDLELLTQGHHDLPAKGRLDIQKHIDSTPAGKYDAIVLGYALCGSILVGLECRHTPIVIPRAHDCITFFLGSRARYQSCFSQRPGTYYFTSGWLECGQRRGAQGNSWNSVLSPANSPANLAAAYDQWVKKYGEEQARYLLSEMSGWAEAYSHGCLIYFDFLKELDLPQRVRQICSDKAWSYDEIPGELSLFDKMLNGPWTDAEFLKLGPGEKVVATFDERIIAAASPCPQPKSTEPGAETA